MTTNDPSFGQTSTGNCITSTYELKTNNYEQGNN